MNNRKYNYKLQGSDMYGDTIEHIVFDKNTIEEIFENNNKN